MQQAWRWPRNAPASVMRWWRSLRDDELAGAVLLPFLVQRLMLFCVVGFATQLVTNEPGWHALPHFPFLDPWLRWDSAYYMSIAVRGVGVSSWGDPAAFFPLYAGAIRVVSLVMPVAWAALVVTNLAAVGALAILYLFFRELAGATAARRAVWIALIFPASFFLSAAYSESTCLLFVAGVFLAWQRGNTRLAVLCAALAALARPVGAVLVTVPFVIGWLWHSRRLSRAPWFVLGVLPGLGFLLLMHGLASGDPLAFMHTRKALQLGGSAWTPQAASWWSVLYDEGIGPTLMRRLLNWGSIALVWLASAVWLRRRQVELAVLTVLTVTFPLLFQRSPMNAASMARYSLQAFPLFLLLAQWAPDGLRARALDAGLVMLQVALAVLFGAWYWAE